MTRRHADRGSVTIWTLGMVLVVMFLGAIAFDLWSGFSARRQYAAAVDLAAQAGANGLDETAFRTTGTRQLDPDRARIMAEDSLTAQHLTGIDNQLIDATTTQVVVEITAHVDVGLLRIFGGGDPLIVHVRAVGQPRTVTP